MADILVATPFPEADLALLSQAGHKVDAWTEARPMLPEEFVERALGVQAIIGNPNNPIDEKVLEATGPGSVITTITTGHEHIDKKACRENGSPVGYSPGVTAPSTANIAVGLMVVTSRQMLTYHRMHQAGDYQMGNPMTDINDDLSEGLVGEPELTEGATVGIIGAGAVGTEVAKRVTAFGADVIYSSPSPKPEFEQKFNARRRPLPDLAEASDFVSLHVPLTAETEGICDAPFFDAMGEGRRGYFINTARGKLVDQEALTEALKAGKVRGAGLEVTDPEPLPVGHPLHDLCEIIYPHRGSATNARPKMARMATNNTLKALADRPMPYPAPGSLPVRIIPTQTH